MDELVIGTLVVVLCYLLIHFDVRKKRKKLLEEYYDNN